MTEQPGFFATTFHATGQMSLVFPDANQSVRDLLKDARLSVAITMPGWVSAQSGGNLNGNTVTYTVHFGESATIDVTGGGLNLPHIALITGGVLLALALFIVGLILLRRGNRLPVETAAYASTSPYYMPTQPGAETPTFPRHPPIQRMICPRRHHCHNPQRLRRSSGMRPSCAITRHTDAYLPVFECHTLPASALIRRHTPPCDVSVASLCCAIE